MIDLATCANCTHAEHASVGMRTCTACGSVLDVIRTVRGGLQTTVLTRGDRYEPEFRHQPCRGDEKTMDGKSAGAWFALPPQQIGTDHHFGVFIRSDEVAAVRSVVYGPDPKTGVVPAVTAVVLRNGYGIDVLCSLSEVAAKLGVPTSETTGG